MFGAYQAGVWKVLAGRFRPDIVAGTSAGALNAWAIAGGATADDLARVWLDAECSELARFRLQLPWRGLFDSRPLQARIRRLCDAYRPQVDVGIVAAEVPRLRPWLFRGGEIDWRHLAAAAAVPFGYRPVRIDGRLYVDGGLLGPLPLWAAVRMGATRIVAVNVLAHPPSRLAGLAARAFRALAPRAPAVPPGIELRIIQPERSLGTLREVMFWNRETALRWIAMGEEAAGRLFRE
jgi:NTE family protein